MKPEIEIRLEMVRLLLQSEPSENVNPAHIIKRAEELSNFVIDGNQTQKNPLSKTLIETVIQDLDSQGPLARALEKWIIRNECLRATFRKSHQKGPISLSEQNASVGLRQGRHLSKR